MSDWILPQSVCQEVDIKVKCDLCSFNADIYHLLEAYLAREEFLAFLQSNKHVHDEYIGYRYISLNRKYSTLYCENETFRDLISTLILAPKRQVSLNIICFKITDVSALGGVHTLNLSGCSNITDVSALGGVHFLNLSHCSNIMDVSALGGVHTFYTSLTASISRM